MNNVARKDPEESESSSDSSVDQRDWGPPKLIYKRLAKHTHKGTAKKKDPSLRKRKSKNNSDQSMSVQASTSPSLDKCKPKRQRHMVTTKCKMAPVSMAQPIFGRQEGYIKAKFLSAQRDFYSCSDQSTSVPASMSPRLDKCKPKLKHRIDTTMSPSLVKSKSAPVSKAPTMDARQVGYVYASFLEATEWTMQQNSVLEAHEWTMPPNSKPASTSDQ